MISSSCVLDSLSWQEVIFLATSLRKFLVFPYSLNIFANQDFKVSFRFLLIIKIIIKSKLVI